MWSRSVPLHYDSIYAVLSIFAPENTLTTSQLVNITIEVNTTTSLIRRNITVDVHRSPKRLSRPTIKMWNRDGRNVYSPG